MAHKSFWLIPLVLTVVFLGCSKETQIVNEETLFEQANKSQMVQNYRQAVEIYKKIINDYPDSPQLDKALFMIGYIKMENLDEKEDALSYFNKLIEKYPNSDLVDDAEFMIESIQSGQDALSTFKNKTSP
jgi:outer membrane protein assembly factor BamD (BamD/ComL family)